MSLRVLVPACVPRRRNERGASALELAFLAPWLLALIFLSIQAALYFYGRNVAIQAAREAVSQLRLAQDAATYDSLLPQVRARTTDFAASVGSGGLNDPQVTFGAQPHYDERFPRTTVSVSGKTISLIPGLDLTAHGTASGSVERFEADE
ncbi:pilus assembly protein [Nocardioides mangrovicus]|uniref:Pilus assembly protein n=1 Tax=Nocardioides mangrovicus TaxID=2478913 RepID=A0A3L8NYX2_9ACTN|nr:TadE/TadG family type IV pilus assembly protein [Nocardioides mangrovicus]RLV47857.1 pilus assembly protein [Nocardioides mangrovicus]